MGIVVARRGSSCVLPDVTPARPAFGLTVSGFPDDPGAVAGVASKVGRPPDIVMWYVAWFGATDFPAASAAQVRARGAVPEISWEPWDPAGGTRQPEYRLDRIVRGDFDAYVTRWAEQARRYAGPVWLRFAHEMNTATYPWSQLDGRNASGSYVAAWTHVRRLFRAAGADNVRWVWSPNIPYAGTTALSELYPGNDQVDVVALDGYNWSTVQPGTRWRSFADIFEPGLDELVSLSARPVVIGEVASAEQGGDKAAWISGMFETLARRPEICGFTWFDLAKETDWRLDSSSAALAAFQAGLRSLRSE